MILPTSYKNGKQTFYSSISRLALLSGLSICLDPGDAASYDSGVQTDKWLDRAGSGYDFYRGSGTGSDAADPTFNGTAGGLSSSEYWSTDGGDRFTYDSANETWMENIHKDNAKFTMVAWVNPANTTGAFGFFGTGGTGSGPGVAIYKPGTFNQFKLDHKNGSTTQTLVTSGGVFTASTWQMMAMVLDEAAGGTASFTMKNASVLNTFDGTYTSPTASSAAFTMEVWGCGNATQAAPSGSFMGPFALWSGVALTSAQIETLYQVTRSRFGV